MAVDKQDTRNPITVNINVDVAEIVKWKGAEAAVETLRAVRELWGRDVGVTVKVTKKK
jgi:hypothetical protein